MGHAHFLRIGILGAITIGCVASCGVLGPIKAYEGDSLPASQTALMTTAPYTTGDAPSDSYGTIRSISIDGKPYASLMSPDDKRDKEYEIREGVRRVTVEYERGINNCGISTNYDYYLGLSGSPIKEECTQKDKSVSTCAATFTAVHGHTYEAQVTTHFAEYGDTQPKTDIEIVDKSAGARSVTKGTCVMR